MTTTTKTKQQAAIAALHALHNRIDTSSANLRADLERLQNDLGRLQNDLKVLMGKAWFQLGVTHGQEMREENEEAGGEESVA